MILCNLDDLGNSFCLWRLYGKWIFVQNEVQEETEAQDFSRRESKDIENSRWAFEDKCLRSFRRFYMIKRNDTI